MRKLLLFIFILGSQHSFAFENVKMLRAGNGYTCVLKNSGEVKCWGSTEDGRSTPPQILTSATDLALGANHACAIQDQKPVCWGNSDFGKTTPPAFTSPVQRVFAGLRNTCVISEGRPVCWGDNSYDKNNVPDISDVVELAVGKFHICALTKSGDVGCWGNNKDGYHTPPKDMGKVKHISAGDFHTCAQLVDGDSRCWGNNVYDQSTHFTPTFELREVVAANGVTGYIDGPVVRFKGGLEAPAGLIDPTSIAIGYDHTCVTSPEGIRCWGDNDKGQSNVPAEFVNIQKRVGVDNLNAFIGCYKDLEGNRFHILPDTSPDKLDANGVKIPFLFIKSDTTLGFGGWWFGTSDTIKSYTSNSVLLEFAQTWFDSKGVAHAGESTRARFFRKPDGTVTVTAWWFYNNGSNGNGIQGSDLRSYTCP